MVEEQEVKRKVEISGSERAISECEKKLAAEQAKPKTKQDIRRLARLADQLHKQLVKQEKLASMINYNDYAKMRNEGYSHSDIKKIVSSCT